MTRFNDYAVRVYYDGDVSMMCHDELQYATMFGQYGMQCNVEEGTEDYDELLRAASDASDAMAALNEVIVRQKNNR